MIARDFWLGRIRQVWERVPIVWLAGVRRVGKTTLVRSLPEADCLYVNCDSPRAAQSVADPEFFFQQVKRPIVVFDEIHQLPDPTRLLKIGADVFPQLKLVATGSSTLAAARKFRDALTGRKRVVALRPVLFSELTAFGDLPLEHRLLRGGLPPSFLAERPDPEFFGEWLDSHFARDVQELFGVSKRSGYLALLQILLRQSGGLLDITKLANQTALSRPTVMHYLEICETTLTVRLVRPYHGGRAREWTHQPKAYAFDTGFICHARGWEHLRSEDCGPLWEHLVLDTLASVEDPTKVQFWRDHQQREVDFVISRGRDAVDAYECKWSILDPDLRNLRAFRQVYPEGKNYLVVPQPSSARSLRLEGLDLNVVSPADLMPAGFD
ncbi:MAG TPA: AAA family ATPase [Verrucomicrobiota bacterium]|nr:ATPase [Verrucomicrobiales bacterium]HRI11407.1 AAA family ATPase [Verrucomicrobiota bacterium]